VLAARELEQTDPELADVCFDVHYLIVRHEWSQAPALPDQRALFVERLAQRQTGLIAVAVVVLVSAALLIVLAFAIPRAAPVARIVMVVCGLAFGGTGGTIAWIVATAPARRRRLLATIEEHPERLARVYGAVLVSHGFRQANLRPIAAPETDHLPARGGGFHLVIELADPTPRERRLGLHRGAVAVKRDEVLALLQWLRSQAPGAAGPPDVAGIVWA